MLQAQPFRPHVCRNNRFTSTELRQISPEIKVCMCVYFLCMYSSWSVIHYYTNRHKIDYSAVGRYISKFLQHINNVFLIEQEYENIIYLQTHYSFYFHWFYLVCSHLDCACILIRYYIKLIMREYYSLNNLKGDQENERHFITCTYDAHIYIQSNLPMQSPLLSSHLY